MKVHNVEWVADGAAQFIQKQGRSLFFLYVGFTLPHGPDAGTGGFLSDAAAFTPAGVWRRQESMVQGTSTARAEVRKRYLTLTLTLTLAVTLTLARCASARARRLP